MVELAVHEKTLEKLEAIAQREHRSVEAVIESLVEFYETAPEHTPRPNAVVDPLDAYIGSLDTDLTDLSTTVRETMTEYYRKKYGNPD
ncbi:MAG: hypothetical protein DPW16_17430 [Chloroflexi bacterium]|nr:hypothetical protein [Chloroflexota bacterium]